MTNPKRALMLGFATVVVVGCQTIREELPTSATSNNGGGSSNLPAIPVVVVPVPVPVPTTGPPSVPTNPTPTTPTPTNPTPNATPKPQPGPVNPGNTSGTVKIGAKVYFIERNGQIMPEGTQAQVGDRIHFDATAKDAQNNPTTTSGSPHWTFTNQGLISVSSTSGDWTPIAIAKHGGSFQAWVEADGVRSNTVNVTIH